MSQISGAASLDNALGNAGTQQSRFSEMNTEDFIKIIFTELTNQDPLQPNDTGALLEQLNSIRSIESDIALTNQLEALVTENQLAAASNMLGKLVTGRTENLDAAGGIVVSALKQGDEIMLELADASIIPIGNVESVLDPAMFAPAGGNG
ncbi:MAG: hypothetical protein HKO59_17605 [Phycisphaerales bacterium]|nr:hypothetical protein [Phycisphaerae bacterium]NNF44758.1 hypothetical protein [Phycisphaerales bacterium]NNM27759.1 hypothetical protein [Phycisphaerales bacterium]